MVAPGITASSGSATVPRTLAAAWGAAVAGALKGTARAAKQRQNRKDFSIARYDIYAPW